MNAAILLGVLACAPVVIAILRRVSAILLFLSVAAGSLLVTYLGDDAVLASRMLARGPNVPMITQIALLSLPVVLTLFFLKRTMARSKLLLHIVPLFAIGLAFAMFTLPLLPSKLQADFFSNPYTAPLKNSQDIVVGTATVMTLLLMLLTLRQKEDKPAKRR